MNKPVRIIIMEPVCLLRFSLSVFIRDHYGSRATVITEVKNLFELREAMMRSPFDVILTALFGEKESLENWWKFDEFLTRFWPATPCLVWSDIPQSYLQYLNPQGAPAYYVNKTVSLEAFKQLLDLASPPLRLLLDVPVRVYPKEMLTRQELDVIYRLCRGGTVKGIARQLGRSIKTISAHKCNAMRKMGVDSTFTLLKLNRAMMHSESSLAHLSP
jgi:two-component system capsular synthesis response regulator RcsB